MSHLYEVHAKSQIKETVLIYSAYIVLLYATSVNEDGWCQLSDVCLEVRAVVL